MRYSCYTLEQIVEDYSKYMELCNMFFELVSDSDTVNKLKEILYEGGCNGFKIRTDIHCKDNIEIEVRRRVSMAYILIRNPETFDILIKNRINLFHGTNANALSSILKYGLCSGAESQKKGIYVSTGERSTRIGGVRDFVSFTDVLEVAQGYSTLKPEGNDFSSFEVVVGTTDDEVIKAGTCVVESDLSEVGVKGKLPLEGIKLICVPSDKFKYVKKIVNSDKIIVSSMDDPEDRFYYIDEFGIIYISNEKYNELKNNLNKKKNGIMFKLGEIKEVVLGQIRKKKGEYEYEGRKHR